MVSKNIFQTGLCPQICPPLHNFIYRFECLNFLPWARIANECGKLKIWFFFARAQFFRCICIWFFSDERLKVHENSRKIPLNIFRTSLNKFKLLLVISFFITFYQWGLKFYIRTLKSWKHGYYSLMVIRSYSQIRPPSKYSNSQFFILL